MEIKNYVSANINEIFILIVYKKMENTESSVSPDVNVLSPKDNIAPKVILGLKRRTAGSLHSHFPNRYKPYWFNIYNKTYYK